MLRPDQLPLLVDLGTVPKGFFSVPGSGWRDKALAASRGWHDDSSCSVSRFYYVVDVPLLAEHTWISDQFDQAVFESVAVGIAVDRATT